MPVFIHVGTQKTGTTSIQKFAAEHRLELRARGLWYPSYREMGLFGHYAHHDLAHALANAGRRLDLDQARAFADYIRKNRKKGESILISAEPFYRHVIPAPPGTEGGAEDYWSERRRYIRRLREMFPGDDVEIVICVRRQDAFARSCYQEFVKVTRHNQGFDDFLDRARHLFQYRENIDLFAEIFPRVAVVIFERLVAEGNLVGRFFATLGVDVRGLAVAEAANPALPCELIEFKRLMNGTAVDDTTLKALGRLLPEVAGAHRGLFTIRYDWASADRLSAFQESFDAGNQAVASAYLGEVSALFPVATNVLPVFPGLDATRLAEISALMFQFLLASMEPKTPKNEAKRR